MVYIMQGYILHGFSSLLTILAFFPLCCSTPV